MHTARSIVSGGEPSALMEEEVLTLSDEERMSLLQKAGITNIAISTLSQYWPLKSAWLFPGTV